MVQSGAKKKNTTTGYYPMEVLATDTPRLLLE